MKNMPPEALEEVAGYFQVLAEPTRVGDLAQMCGYTAANVSRHLSLMTKNGLVTREGRGTSVYYRFADESVYALCDLVCDNIARQIARSEASRASFSVSSDLE